MDEKTRAALADLGFQAASHRTFSGLLADACARLDLSAVCDLVQELLDHDRVLAAQYVHMLAQLQHSTRELDPA